MKSTDRVRYNYYSIDFACVSIEFITKSQCMDGKWIAFGHSEGSSYFYSRGYLKYLMVEYRLFPVFIIKIRICVQIVNTGIFAKLKDKGYIFFPLLQEFLQRNSRENLLLIPEEAVSCLDSQP